MTGRTSGIGDRSGRGAAARASGVLLAAAMLLPAAGARSEETRTLSAELSGVDVENFAVENLAGTLRIVPATDAAGQKVAVVATVHAESAELASGVRLERVPEGGAAVLRVRYPDGVRTIRYREPRSKDDISITLDLFSSNHVDYDGRSYRIASGHGKKVWADVEVRVPARVGHARFRNLVGLVEAEGFEGKLRFEVSTADLRLRRLSGDLSLTGSSADTRAEEIHGAWSSEFSSGDCDLEGFEGESISFRTASGDVRGGALKAAHIRVNTSSGDVSLRRADVEDFTAETSSGDVRLQVEGTRLRQFRAHTSSGDVALRLPSDASFEAVADQSSGDMNVGFSGGDSTIRRDKLVAYRRGDGAARIRVETSSGDLWISPN